MTMTSLALVKVIFLLMRKTKSNVASRRYRRGLGFGDARRSAPSTQRRARAREARAGRCAAADAKADWAHALVVRGHPHAARRHLQYAVGSLA
jgi:hypothetical protein